MTKQGEPRDVGILQGFIAESQAGLAERPVWIDDVYSVTDKTNLR
jgi:hypothetical protein